MQVVVVNCAAAGAQEHIDAFAQAVLAIYATCPGTVVVPILCKQALKRPTGLPHMFHSCGTVQDVVEVCRGTS